MLAFYYLLAVILWLVSAPFVLILSLFKKKYKSSLKARFFLWQNPRPDPADVHFHACSYGEVRSICPLAKRYKSRVSVITQTGFELASKQFKTSFLPFEIFLPFWFTPCKVLVLFEAELWLMLVFSAKLKGAKIILINARISDKSEHKYKRFAFFYKKIFSFIDEVYAQSKLDKERLEALGAKNVTPFFNIKASLKPELKYHFKPPAKRLIVLASTHEGEEELLLNNLDFKAFLNTQFVVVPRHPERFKAVQSYLEKLSLKNSLKLSIFSQSGLDAKADILLIDALGVLNDIYAISCVCVLCGSFLPGIGGHNPAEPASFENIVISGEFIHNQTSLYEKISNIYFTKAQDLPSLLKADLKKAKAKSMQDLTPIYKSIEDGLSKIKQK